MIIETVSYAGETPTITLTPYDRYGFKVEGGTSFDMGLFVEAYVNGILICRQFVHADSVFEPNTKNMGGKLGAYRDVPPAEFIVANARAEVAKKAVKILNRKLLADTYDGKVWLTKTEVRALQKAYYGGNL